MWGQEPLRVLSQLLSSWLTPLLPPAPRLSRGVGMQSTWGLQGHLQGPWPGVPAPSPVACSLPWLSTAAGRGVFYPGQLPWSSGALKKPFLLEAFVLRLLATGWDAVGAWGSCVSAVLLFVGASDSAELSLRDGAPWNVVFL